MDSNIFVSDDESSVDSSDSSKITSYGTTLFEHAVMGSVAPIARHVMECETLPVIHDMNTVLHVHLTFARNISIRYVSFVVEHFPGLIFETNISGDSPLHIAARYGQSDIVRLLMTAAAPEEEEEEGEEEEGVLGVLGMLRIKNNKGDTALHEAVRNNSVDDVKLLLECEDDISDLLCTPNNLGETPLYMAASKGYEAIIERFMQRHKLRDEDLSGNKSVMIGAVLSRNVETLQLLLKAQPDSLAKTVDENGWNPLHYAANGNDKRGYKVVQTILQYKKSVAYFGDDKKRTALHMAACRGNVRIMQEIMSICPDCIHLTDSKGWNVLHYAVASESDDALKLVLQNPSHPRLVTEMDNQGNTPLHLLAVSRDCLPSFLNVKYLMDLVRFEFPVTAFNRFPIFRRKLLDDLLQPKELVLEWMNDIGKGPSGIDQMVDLNHFQKLKRKNEEEMADRLDRAKDYHLVVASLVATVTFAAAFTVPGGFVSDGSFIPRKGSPILLKNSAFKAFFVFDAIAMALSTSSVFVYIILAIIQNKRRYDWLMRSALWFIILAMSAMVLAFVTGAYAVLSDSLVYAACICAIALSFFVYVFYVMVKIVMESLSRHQEYGPIYRSLLSMWRRSPFHFCK